MLVSVEVPDSLFTQRVGFFFIALFLAAILAGKLVHLQPITLKSTEGSLYEYKQR